MNTICVPLPHIDLSHTVDLDVTIDGVRHSSQYRVEAAPWPAEADPLDRIDTLRDFIVAHRPEWELVQIGPPEAERVPVTFRRTVKVQNLPKA